MRHSIWLAAGMVVICACSDPPPSQGTPDASSDVKPDKLVDQRDASDAEIKGCRPADVSSFSPSWVPPKPASAACTEQTIAQYANDCLDPATRSTTACTAFQTANKSCVACLVTPESASSYGAAISRSNGVISLNVGGCIALLSGDLSPAGCGGKYDANRQCAAASCDDVCAIPDGDDPAFQAYLKCVSDSAKTTCKSYAAAVCAEADAGAVAACSLNGASFVDNFKALAPIFCASGG
ncbi:hypothetical protein BH09MYX1_BH09MYX1_56870 [soil metagenome]